MKGFKLIVILAGVLIFIVPMFSFAGEVKESEETEGYSVIKLEEIVVTGTKTEKKVAEVPQAVVVITKEEIESTGSLSVTDYFQRVPGVAVHDYGSVGFGNQFYFRGYDYLRMYNNLDFQVDGVTIHSGADYGNPILNNIPKAAIDHIEFLKGTGASMYGAQAFIGVINTSIKRKIGAPEGEISIGYGSWHRRYTSMGVTGSQDNFGCTLAADLAKGDTYQDHQSFRHRTILFAPTIQLGADTSIEATFLYGDREVDNPFVTYLTEDQERRDRRQNFDRGELNAPLTFVGLGLTHEFGNHIQWVIKSGYYHEREKSYLVGDGSGNSWYDWGWDYRSHRHLDSYGVETHLSFLDLGTEGSILTTGLEYHFDDAEQTTAWGGFPDKDAQAEINNYAIFAQYEWKVMDKLTLTGGGRWDFFDTDIDDKLNPEQSFSRETESEISPRAGVNWEVLRNVNLFANVGTGFRVPNAYELAAEPSLDPEESVNYEVGVKARVSKFWETTFSLYRTDYEDMILNWGIIDPDTGARENIWTNAGEVRFQGIDWANYFNFGKGFSGYFHMLLDDSEYEDYKSDPGATRPFDYSDEKVPYHPRTQLKWGLEYKGFGWRVGFDGRYYDDYYSDQSGDFKADSDSYVNVDFHASYTYKMATLTLFVNNIFDEEYYASAWRDMQNPAPESNILVQGTIRF